MTTKQLKLVTKVESNRGVIKSRKHIDMLCDISDYAIDEWIKELEEQKHFGIKFVWDVVTSLNIKDQRLLFIDIFSGISPVNITNAKMKFRNIK